MNFQNHSMVFAEFTMFEASEKLFKAKDADEVQAIHNSEDCNHIQLSCHKSFFNNDERQTYAASVQERLESILLSFEDLKEASLREYRSGSKSTRSWRYIVHSMSYGNLTASLGKGKNVSNLSSGKVREEQFRVAFAKDLAETRKEILEQQSYLHEYLNKDHPDYFNCEIIP